MHRRTIIALAVAGIGVGLLAAQVARSSPNAGKPAASPSRGPVTTVPWNERLATGWMRQFDADHDGYLTVKEYEAGGGITTRIGQWPFASLDRDGDGQAGRIELVQAIDDYFAPRLTDLAASALRQADVNGDGRLGRAELEAAIEAQLERAVGMQAGQAREVIASFDRDGDRLLNQEELALAIADAFVRAYAPLGAEIHPALRRELMVMFRRDQEVRRPLAATAPASEVAAHVAAMQDADRRHTARLKAVVDEYGWPTRSLVGDDGAIAAWCLAQHADHDVAFQRQCLPLLEAAARVGEARWSDVAYLTDRILVNEGKHQRYGTQFHSAGGQLVPKPIDEPNHVDMRREQVGLGPLAEYAREMRQAH